MNAKLTAYALNELPPDERAALEAEMQTNPALRAEAEEMQKFCTLLHDEVADADKTALTMEQRVRVLREFSADTQPLPKKAGRSIWRHPAFLVPTAIAACTTVMLVINLKEKHAPLAAETEPLVEQRLTERVEGKISPEDVRISLERAEKTVASTGHPPTPGKPQMPALVAENSPVIFSGESKNLPPMPTPGMPASPALPLPPSVGKTSSSILMAEVAGPSGGAAAGASPIPGIKGGSYDDDASDSATALGRPPSGPQSVATRGIDIGAARPLESYRLTPAMPDGGYRDLNEPTLKITPGGTVLSDANTYTGGTDLNGAITASGSTRPALDAGGTAPADNPPPVLAGVPILGNAFGGTAGMTKVGTGTMVLAPSLDALSVGEPVTDFAQVPSIVTDGAAPTSAATAMNDNITPENTSGVPANTRAKMLNEVNRGWEDPVAQNTAAGRATVNTAGKAEDASRAVKTDKAELALIADQMPVAGSEVPAAPAAPAAAPAPAPTLATAPMAAAAAPGKPTGTDAYGPGFAIGVFGAGILPEDPAAAAPAPDPLLAHQEQFKRRILNESLTVTEQELETLKRERENTLEKLKQLHDAEARGRKPTTRNPGGETYTPIYENPFLQVTQQPLSTFSIDVDTASYANVRRFLNNGQRPPPDAVRLEELINYFPYTYEPPAEDGAPFSVTVDMAEAPWQPAHRLARIALKGREIRQARGVANFVFLVDVSGSMDSPDKLPLVKQSLRMLTEQLKDNDRVALVTYAGESGVALKSTPGSERKKILNAIDNLDAGGSTNGSGGIRMAYQQASENFIPEGVNRVILCTDGDFNVGISSPEELEKLITEKAKSRVFLSVLGYGTGNLKDRTMETLADKGNGNYAYIDSLSEARKVLVDQMNATLVTIAKDVKIQVEFNPGQVAAYRLLGYENRALAKEDFNNDRKDAGEIGAGHTVTALYEIVPVGARMTSPDGRPSVDDLKYAPKPAPIPQTATPAPAPGGGSPSRETMTVKLRYKQPEGDKSQLIEVPVTDKEQTMGDAPQDFVFAAGVTGFGMMLRNSQYSGELTWDMVRALALRGKGEDPLGYRGEFLQLIDKARGLTEGRE